MPMDLKKESGLKFLIQFLLQGRQDTVIKVAREEIVSFKCMFNYSAQMVNIHAY